MGLGCCRLDIALTLLSHLRGCMLSHEGEVKGLAMGQTVQHPFFWP